MPFEDPSGFAEERAKEMIDQSKREEILKAIWEIEAYKPVIKRVEELRKQVKAYLSNPDNDLSSFEGAPSLTFQPKPHGEGARAWLEDQQRAQLDVRLLAYERPEVLREFGCNGGLTGSVTKFREHYGSKHDQYITPGQRLILHTQTVEAVQ